MRSVLSVTTLPQYQLLLTFDNNEQKLYDMSADLYGIFDCLKAPENFNAIKIVSGAPTWVTSSEYELELCPDTLYMQSEPCEI